MVDATEYIKDLVSQISNEMFGTFDGSKTLVEDTKWARVGKIIVDDANNQYTITDLVTDSYLVAEPIGHNVDLNGTFYIDNPFWLTGTKMATNREWTLADDNLENKLPLIWLLEIINETGYGKGSSIERDIDIRLFFLDETDPSQYYTKDHREQVVKPMQKLMNEFLKVISSDRMYKEVETFSYRTFSRFGAEKDNGVFENVLDANLSGVALELKLTRYKKKYC